MTTGGNYLILLPSPPPCPSSNRIGVRRRYGGGGGRERGGRLISSAGNLEIFSLPPPPPSRGFIRFRLKYDILELSTCDLYARDRVIEKEPSIFYHPPSRLVTRPMLRLLAVLFPLFHARVAGSECSLKWPPDPRLIMFIRVYIRTVYIYILLMSCESSQIAG